MTMYIYLWNKNSEGGVRLSEVLNIRRIRHENSTFKGTKNRTVINWGSSELPAEALKANVLNHPDAVKNCANKLKFFDKVSGKVSTPDWTTDSEVALGWIKKGDTVCARKILSGHSGEGLVIMTADDIGSFTKAPLYTKYVPKKHEYRIHVVRGTVTDMQRKILRPGYLDENPEPNWHVRNHANGFIYVRNDVNPPKAVIDQAVLAIKHSGLDFGAVDVIYNAKKEQAYVLEINTAPGIEGESVNNYAEAFRQIR